uniref:L-dopachrome isomerase n=1 Tax=Magallana gigas TaxID=29159 RepID=A0A8W8K680_MAGGI
MYSYPIKQTWSASYQDLNCFADLNVTVRVHPDQMMTLGGTSDPCASVELCNISDGAKTKEDAVAIANFLENKLSIPQSRFYITFTKQSGKDISHGGKTLVNYLASTEKPRRFEDHFDNFIINVFVSITMYNQCFCTAFYYSL